jgi:hypothetical protein
MDWIKVKNPAASAVRREAEKIGAANAKITSARTSFRCYASGAMALSKATKLSDPPKLR